MDDYVNRYMYAESTDSYLLFLRVYRDKGCLERSADILRRALGVKCDQDFVKIEFTNHNINDMKWLGRTTQETLRTFLHQRNFTYTTKKDTLTIGRSWCSNTGRFVPTLINGLTVILT